MTYIIITRSHIRMILPKKLQSYLQRLFIIGQRLNIIPLFGIYSTYTIITYSHGGVLLAINL